MKKALLLLFCFLGYFTAQAQLDCATDIIEITENGIVNAPTVSGTYVSACFNDNFTSDGGAMTAIWYKFTPDTDGEVTINSNLPQNVTPNSTDTRLSVFKGSCSNLICYQKNDDPAPGSYLSVLTFPVLAGVTYYIAWDNFWDDSDFDFDFSFTSVSCLKVYNVQQPTDLTDSSAMLHWDVSQSNPQSYDVEYGPIGFAHGTGIMVNATANAVVLNNLTTGNSYDYYIRSECGSGNVSDWSGVKKLTMAKVCPYASGFDTADQLSGWTSSGNGNGGYGLGTLASQAQSPSQFWIFNTGTTGSMDNWLYAPPILVQAGESVTVSFWTRCITSRSLRVTVGSANNAAAQTTVVWSNPALLNTTYTQTTTPVWTAPQTGIYYFAFNDVSASAATATLRLDTVTFSSTVLDVDNNSTIDFAIYPNPTKDIVTISGQDLTRITTVELFDLNGRKVKTFNPQIEQHEFSISDLAKGIYALKVEAKGMKAIRKIVKE